jgi:site-specific DNA-methyltransferase (adenine-specific)
MTINPALYSSNNEHFCTPPEFLETIYKFKTIEVDPCSNPGSLVKSNKFYFKHDDGLKQEWSRNNELTFVNPPYGREILKWVKKCFEEYKLGSDVVLLIPSRPGTKAWQNIILKQATSICFLKGRIQFYDYITKKPAQCWSKKKNKMVDAKAPFDSALIYFGNDKTRFDNIFNDYGVCR